MAVTGFTKLGAYPKLYQAADQGVYQTVTNPTPGTGVITGVVTSLADTTPYIIIKNNNPVGSLAGQPGPSIYLDKIVLDCTVVGVTFSGSRKFAHKIDTSQTTARYTSGAGAIHGAGQTNPINNTNGGAANASNALVYVGAITAGAAGAARLIESGTLCSAIEVVFSTFVFDFGAPLSQPLTGLVDNSTTPMHKYFPCAGIVLAPQQHYLLHIWGATLGTGITFAYNLGFWEV